jgi:CBS domain-containing protein
MKVKDAMTRDVRICGINDDLARAARTMWMRNCGVLPVVDKHGEVVGILTDRDVCIAAGCRNWPPTRIAVADVMTRRVYSCAPETDIHEALRIMRDKKVRRLPVIDATRRLCGILSLNDVAIKALGEHNPAELSANDVEDTLAAICSHGSTIQRHAA